MLQILNTVILFDGHNKRIFTAFSFPSTKPTHYRGFYLSSKSNVLYQVSITLKQ